MESTGDSQRTGSALRPPGVALPYSFPPIYLREVGLGFGYRYTNSALSRLSAAALSPSAIVAVLDQLASPAIIPVVQAWVPQPSVAGCTLTIRASVGLSTSSRIDASASDSSAA